MSEAPLVTIGLPAYNRERFIRKSLESLLAQTYTNFVLIISDNASTDATSDICREYAARDSRIRYHRNEVNIGNPRNFNRIAELTTTKYLKWSTTDDLWEPTFLERAVPIMESDPSIALCYPKTYVIDAEGKNPTPYEDGLNLMQDDPAERFLTLVKSIGLAHQHLGVIRMSCLRKTRLLGTHVASDLNLLAELALYGKFYELPERLFYRRMHDTSGSWRRADKQHQAKHYHGATKRGGHLTNWHGHLGFFSAVHRSPLPASSRLHIYGHLLKRMVWDRRELVHELVDYARAPRKTA
ncbi:MAG TPA: glycosyltransferase [Steroidobacteraceae bacterium]|nr:glycosyltransferase [Steroidobacteraceae bacterium]